MARLSRCRGGLRSRYLRTSSMNGGRDGVHGPPSMHWKGFEMSHELYAPALTAMFLFWNVARIFTYLPTIARLLTRETDVRSYSLLTWASWVLSNGTFALMLLEMSRGRPTQL